MTGLQKGVGGKMAGATASEQFQDLTNSRLRTLSSQMTRKLGKTLIARNFGAKIAEQNCPIIKLRFVERDDPELLSKVALTLKQAGAGEAVGVEDLVRRCAMKIAAVGDKNLGAAGPEAGPAAAFRQEQRKPRLGRAQRGDDLVDDLLVVPDGRELHVCRGDVRPLRLVGDGCHRLRPLTPWPRPEPGG